MRFIFFRLLSRYWQPVSALIFFAIVVLSLWPLPSLPKIPGTDKTHHFIAYTVLAFPVAMIRPYHWRKILIAFIVASATIEFLQPLVNRHCEFLDFSANIGGIACGAGLAWLTRLLIDEQKSN